jgi:hypothetical protein
VAFVDEKQPIAIVPVVAFPHPLRVALLHQKRTTRDGW